jgi:SAM-dependent methyltransferase
MTTDPDFALWRSSLEEWAIPQHILDLAPESPWIHPVESFRPDGNLYADTPSRLRALEPLHSGGTSVLDVGCGGGRAALGLVPPARHLVGVDHQQGMLDVFSSESADRGVTCNVHLGDWPNVAEDVPQCDVVVCHHVLYNVQDLRPFIVELTTHARRRVVVEIPDLHPLSSMSPAWRHFWGLERPSSPTSDTALRCIRSLGLDAHLEHFTVPVTGGHAVTDSEVRHTRIRLCLTADRDPEVRSFLEQNPRQPRNLATIWWDTGDETVTSR